MIWLDRNKVTVPEDWEQRVARRFLDYAAYKEKASKFEGLPLEERKDGFKKYAPEVLPKAGFPQIWGEAKDELEKMSYKKCSYCEGPSDHRGHGQVEHFKPKAIFPSLAYDWNNYFLSCAGCNRPKSSRWPNEGGYVRPDQGDPSKRFRFQKDGKMEAVEKDDDAQNTMRDFNLNESWLVYWRRLTIEKTLKLLDNLVREICPLDGEIARRMACRVVELHSDPKLPYSTAVTQCLRRAWNAACPDAPL